MFVPCTTVVVHYLHKLQLPHAPKYILQDFLMQFFSCSFFWAGSVYGGKNDAERFGFFCHAALEFLLQSGFHPVSSLVSSFSFLSFTQAICLFRFASGHTF
jgi:glycogen synthase